MNEAKQKIRLTSLERAWILYDVGNSAFVLLVATLIPIFFNALAEGGGLSSVEYLAYWGYAASAVTVITAVLSPILGTLADTRNFKKPIFTFCVAVGVIGCCAMGMANTWLPFLLIFIFAKVGFSGSLVFYDSMLSDVTVPDRMDEVSSKGYAWGYIGSCVPFVVCLALVLGAGGAAKAAALALALTNQVLSATGHRVLPIESAELEQLVSTGLTIATALVSWWKNNSFTPEAIEADDFLCQLKEHK